MAVTAPDLSDQNPVTGQKDPDQNQDAEVGEAVPEIEDILHRHRSVIESPA